MSEELIFVSTSSFEAALFVPLLVEGHRSRRFRGHGFLAEVRCVLPDDWASFPGGD